MTAKVKHMDDAYYTLLWAQLTKETWAIDMAEVRQLVMRCQHILSRKDGFGNSLLHIAVDKKHGAAVECLLTAGIDVDVLNNDLTTPLLWMLKKSPDKTFDTTKYVRLFIERGADVNAYDLLGDGVLATALFEKHNAAATLLYHAGARFNVKENPLNDDDRITSPRRFIPNADGRLLKDIYKDFITKIAKSRLDSFLAGGMKSQKTLPRKKAIFKKKP